MSILDKWLKAKEIKSFSDLNEEEKQTYREYEQALSGRRLTDDEVQTFLNQELELAVDRLTEVDLTQEAQSFRKCEVRMIKKIINFLAMPALEKQMAEKQLEAQLK